MTTTTRRCGTPALVLVDTSVWIDVFRDPAGRVRDERDRDFVTIAEVRRLRQHWL